MSAVENTQIIQSLADTDWYKLTMQQVVLHQFPGAMVEYRFKCRNTPLVPLIEFKQQIEEQITALCDLFYTDAELEFIAKARYIKEDFVDFLRIFRLQRRFVRVEASKENKGELDIIVRGPWLQTIPFEVPILAIVSEVYFRNVGSGMDLMATAYDKLETKISEMKRLKAEGRMMRRTPFIFFEFGTRRRFGREFQRHAVKRLKEELPEFMKGTSNILLAKDFDLAVIGTQAHEYWQACQAMATRLRDFQKFALEVWNREYDGNLGIALSDVIGMDAFLKDFGRAYSYLYQGARHDSGDPYVWGEKLVAHYKGFDIDPLTKQAVFSDGLSFRRAVELYNAFGDRIKTGYGIGTFITNDCGLDPLNLVMKMVECNGQPVAKLSDAPGKSMCRSSKYMERLADEFNVELKG